MRAARQAMSGDAGTGRRFCGAWRETRTGQDLVEYAYLTFFVALATVGVLLATQAAIGSAFSTSTTAVDGLWVPPDPVSGS